MSLRLNRITGVLTLVCYLLAYSPEGSYRGLASESEAQPSGGSENHLGDPGVEEVIEVNHWIDRLIEMDTSSLVGLFAILGAAASLHHILHAMNELRMHRRHSLHEMQNEHVDLERREKLAQEVMGAERALIDLNESLKTAREEYNKHLKELRAKGNRLKGKTRIDFMVAVNGLDRLQEASPKQFHQALERWIRSSDGKVALRTPQGRRWLSEYREKRQAIQHLQLSFLQATLNFENKISPFEPEMSQGSGRFALPPQFSPTSRIRRVDPYGHPIQRLTPQEIADSAARRSNLCQFNLRNLLDSAQGQAKNLKWTHFYFSKAYRNGALTDIGIFGGFVGAAYLSFKHHQSATGRTLYEDQMKKKADWNVRFQSRTDLAGQLSTQEGYQELKAFHDIIFSVLNDSSPDNHNAQDIRDHMHAIFSNRYPGETAILPELDKLASKPLVTVANQVGISNTAREVGTWELNRDQFKTLLISDDPGVSQFRTLFLSRHLEKLPQYLWPSLGTQATLPPALQQRLIVQIEKRLKEAEANGTLKADPHLSVPFPGMYVTE